VRKYSVSEIIDMRNALNRIVPMRESRAERATEIEEQLRTYMANGTTIEELMQEVRRLAVLDQR